MYAGTIDAAMKRLESGGWKSAKPSFSEETVGDQAVRTQLYTHIHVTPISVLKAGHVEHLPQCIYIYNLWVSISLSLSLSFH